MLDFHVFTTDVCFPAGGNIPEFHGTRKLAAFFNLCDKITMFAHIRAKFCSLER